MNRNRLEIHTGDAHAMTGDGMVIFNGVELVGVRGLTFALLPNETLSAVITVRVDDILVDGATVEVLKEAYNAEI